MKAAGLLTPLRVGKGPSPLRGEAGVKGGRDTDLATTSIRQHTAAPMNRRTLLAFAAGALAATLVAWLIGGHEERAKQKTPTAGAEQARRTYRPIAPPPRRPAQGSPAPSRYPPSGYGEGPGRDLYGPPSPGGLSGLPGRDDYGMPYGQGRSTVPIGPPASTPNGFGGYRFRPLDKDERQASRPRPPAPPPGPPGYDYYPPVAPVPGYEDLYSPVTPSPRQERRWIGNY